MSDLEQMSLRLRNSAGMLRAQADALVSIAEELRAMMECTPDWCFPVGTEEFPPAAWYVRVVHDLTGRKNAGYKHSGIDINLDRWPWGDVERGAPVFAVADGIVRAKGSSAGWLGVVVLEVEHHGMALQVRYGHLEPESIKVRVRDTVKAGQELGSLGDWRGGDGGDHLHFDMAWSYFGWNWWLTPKVDWLDPLPVLREHLGESEVELMCGKGDG